MNIWKSTIAWLGFIKNYLQDKNTDIATLGFIGGFIVMMTLDVALG